MGFADWFGAFINPEGKTLGEPIRALTDQAKSFGLSERDATNALSMLECAEYECAFDIIVQQLYECDIIISAEYLHHLDAVAKRMNLPEQSYSFVKEPNR